MKLLHVIASTDPRMGGVSQAIRTMISGLTELGIHSEVVCLDRPGALFLGKDPFRVHALGPAKGPWCYSATLIPWLIENLAAYDVVIVHGLWLYHGYAVLRSLQRLRRSTAPGKHPRFFVMPHGMLDPYFQRASGRKLKSIRNWIYWKLVERRIINGSNGELFTCAEECRLARGTFPSYRPKSERVVGLGVEKPPTYKAAMRQTFNAQCIGLGNRNYILFLGRIHEKKGVDLLIKAYSAVTGRLLAKASVDPGKTQEEKFAEIIPREQPALVVAGPGLQTAYGKKMQKMASENTRLRDSVFFVDMLSGDAKWGAMYGCDVFVLPSHQENFGIAVVEALACGKPVLISNQVNIWPEIQSERAGLVAADSEEGTRQMLSEWWNLAGTEKERMSQKASTSYARHFAVGSAAGRMFEALTA